MSKVLYQSVLPSGRCIRIAQLTTREKLAADRRVTDRNGNDADALVETIATALRAYTAPVPLVFVKDKDGNDTTIVDIDATLAALPETAWIPCTYVSLVSEGPTNLLDVFEYQPDFQALQRLNTRAQGYADANGSLLAGKAQLASVAS